MKGLWGKILLAAKQSTSISLINLLPSSSPPTLHTPAPAAVPLGLTCTSGRRGQMGVASDGEALRGERPSSALHTASPEGDLV